MFVSQARIDANRKNAQKSTGPKTEEGKRISRANALTHGLCASIVVPEDANTVMTRTNDFFNTLKPQNNYHCWLVTEISLASIKIDRCERQERRARDKVSIKAELCWDDDKRLEAALLGHTLGNRPDVVIEQLKKTPQGCDWLISRWAMLAYSADTKKSWTPAQTQLVFDLLGTPPEFREGHQAGTLIDSRGKLIESADSPADVARRVIIALELHREMVSHLDEANRALTIADLGDDNDPELKRIRRYESKHQSHLRWCVSQLRFQSPMEQPLRDLKPYWLGENVPPMPEVAAEAKLPEPLPLPATPPPAEYEPCPGLKMVHPPFNLEPDEVPAPGEKLDVLQILASRQEKKLKKADARREARRRKIEKLRA